MGPVRTDKRTNKKQLTKKGGKANATAHASREKENNTPGRTSANPTGDRGSGHQTNLEQELAELKGKDIDFTPLMMHLT
jgi:hypothetical protein